MDVDDFRSVLENCGVDLWNFIDTAITVASLDYGIELKHRRDGIVERLYAATRCTNCDVGRIKAALPKGKRAEEDSPSTPQSVDLEGLFVDDEQKRILDIKDSLEDPHLPEDSVVDLLQSLGDMDITFKALKETDIGRHVNLLRKHSSSDVRRLVKQLVRKWKETVDNWVRLNQRGELAASSTIIDGDSPQQKTSQNEHYQVPDFASSANPLNGSPGSEKNNSDPEPPKPKPMPQKKTLPKLAQSVAMSASSQNRHREHKERESTFDTERLASARKRLQDNYKEAENAKKQRTIQVMGIHEIPKPKNTFFGKNKGGGSQGRHW